MENSEIQRRLIAKGIRNVDLARALGIDSAKVGKAFGKEGRRFTIAEMDIIRGLLGEADAPLGSLPVIGQVTAGNWREAVQNPIGSMPRLDPSIPARAFALEISGDSMDLYVDDGGRVVVDPDDKALFPDRFYVVQNADGETTFKQFKMPPARLVPCSTNKTHKEIIIGADPFEVVGRVIWRGAPM